VRDIRETTATFRKNAGSSTASRENGEVGLTIVFPIAAEDEMTVSGVNRTILHVDDDPQFTRIVARRLASRGYEVVSLNDPRQALAELVRHGYRIVILDIDMPGVDGIELMRRIKEFDGGIQVIMLTGLVTLSNAMAAFRRGAEACYFKPLESIDELCRSRRHVLQDRALVASPERPDAAAAGGGARERLPPASDDDRGRVRARSVGRDRFDSRSRRLR
jgi:DNA-binding response OmpR family regulator